MDNKKELRKNIRQTKRLFTNRQLVNMSLSIINKVINHHKVAEAQTVMMYYSLPDEVHTHQAINTLVAMGKTVVLPVVIDNENMELRHYEGEKDLQMGAYNIMEPTGKLFTRCQDIDVAIIPGMGFDAKGNRLGRGKGYYDRFLNGTNNKAYKIGVCFPFQLLASIPTNKHDHAVDEVICGI